MVAKKIIKLMVAVLLINLSILSTADALTLTAKCYVGASRSRVAVQVSGQAGYYLVSVFSGSNIKTSKIRHTDLKNYVGFVFDSKLPIIVAGNVGATAISSTFIHDNEVIVRLRDGVTGRLLGAIGPMCSPI